MVVCTERDLAAPLAAFLATLNEVLPGAGRVLFAGGEGNKNRQTKARLEDALLRMRAGRDTVLVAVGGGVVTDLVGFAAGTYLRGIPYVNVPTSLVGMVDAALGGKTAVNTPRGKNLIGLIHPPAGVCIALEALRTLPGGEFRNGLGECLKHGAIADSSHFAWITGQDSCRLMTDEAALRALVETSVRVKMSVVEDDPAERSGRRHILNAGHTVAHALEILSGFRIGHGEAVAAGLCWESASAVAQGLMPRADCHRLVEGVRSVGFDDRRGVFAPEQVYEAAGWDKKNRGGTVNYVPLGAIGRPALPAPHTAELPLEALQEGLALLEEC